MITADLDLRAALEQPYPGLRSFQAHESFLFFGRQNHVHELLRRLATNRLEPQAFMTEEIMKYRSTKWNGSLSKAHVALAA